MRSFGLRRQERSQSKSFFEFRQYSLDASCVEGFNIEVRYSNVLPCDGDRHLAQVCLIPFLFTNFGGASVGLLFG